MESWGFHEREGIFVIAGPGIEPQKKAIELKIEDVLPTLLYALGIPEPPNLDGVARVDLFSERWQAEHPIGTTQLLQKVKLTDLLQEQAAYSKEDKQQLDEQMRRLGYLS